MRWLKSDADLLIWCAQSMFRQLSIVRPSNCKRLHNKKCFTGKKMITSCEQNHSITPCDWCLDISQLTTLHKPQMIHKNQWLLEEQYLTKGDRH